MHGTNDAARGGLSAPHGLTRRGFIRTGGAATVGAFALLLPAGCCSCGKPAPNDEVPPGRSGSHDDNGARQAGDHQPGKAHAKAAHPDVQRATCVVVTEDGKTAVTSDDFGAVVAYDVDTLKATPFTRKHQGKVAYVSVVGRRVLSAGYDGEVVVHHLDHPLDENPPTFRGHRRDGQDREVWVAVLSADGNLAASAANDGQILLWDPNKADTEEGTAFTHEKGTPPAPVGGLAFLPPDKPDPAHFLSTYAHGVINIWSKFVQDKPIHQVSHDNSFPVNGLVVANKAAEFVSGGFDGTVRVWELPKVLDEKSLRGIKKEKFKMKVRHKNKVWRVAVNADGSRAASASQDGTVRLWKMADGSEIPLDPPADPGKRGSMGVAFAGNVLLYTTDGSDTDTLLAKRVI